MRVILHNECTRILDDHRLGVSEFEEFQAYLPVVTTLMTRSRARHGQSLHLVNAISDTVQAKTTFNVMAEAIKQNVKASDLCAVVLQSALTKMQINWMPDNFGRQFFSNPSDARSWLLEQANPLEERRNARL